MKPLPVLAVTFRVEPLCTIQSDFFSRELLETNTEKTDLN